LLLVGLQSWAVSSVQTSCVCVCVVKGLQRDVELQIFFPYLRDNMTLLLGLPCLVRSPSVNAKISV